MMNAQTEPRRKPMATTVTVNPRKNYCPCGRYLGESTADEGYMMVKCEKCGVWRRVDFGEKRDVRSR